LQWPAEEAQHAGASSGGAACKASRGLHAKQKPGPGTCGGRQAAQAAQQRRQHAQHLLALAGVPHNVNRAHVLAAGRAAPRALGGPSAAAAAGACLIKRGLLVEAALADAAQRRRLRLRAHAKKSI
jgi:hypothetical protein